MKYKSASLVGEHYALCVTKAMQYDEITYFVTIYTFGAHLICP